MSRFPFLLCLALFTFTSAVGAGELHVPATYPTLQDAVDAAAAGDTVTVAPGTYPDTLSVPAIPLLIRSSTGNPADCILDGSSFSPPAGEPFITFQVDAGVHRTLSGLTVRNATSAITIPFGSVGTVRVENCVFENNGPWGCITAGDGSLEVADSRFEGNECYAFGGAIRVSRHADIRNSVFLDNKALPYLTIALTQGGAIHTLTQAGAENSMLEVSGCTFERNHCTDYGGAIHVAANHNAVIQNNRFVENTADACAGAIYVAFSSRNVDISYNTSIGDISPAAASIGVHGMGGGTTVHHNTVVDAVGNEAIRCEQTSGASVSGNVVTGSTGWGIRWVNANGTSSCNLAWNNTFGDFSPAGTDNASADPEFCDPDAGDYSVSATSPALGANSGCGSRGAWEQGCTVVPVQGTTWGALKTRFAGSPD